MAEVSARSQVVGQDVVNVYANLTDDHNPLHVDAEYAAKTAFGGTILHGTIPCALLLDELMQLDISYPFVAEFKFIAPAPVGLTLDLAVQKDDAQNFECIASANGQPLVIGSVRKEE